MAWGVPGPHLRASATGAGGRSGPDAAGLRPRLTRLVQHAQSTLSGVSGQLSGVDAARSHERAVARLGRLVAEIGSMSDVLDPYLHPVPSAELSAILTGLTTSTAELVRRHAEVDSTAVCRGPLERERVREIALLLRRLPALTVVAVPRPAWWP